MELRTENPARASDSEAERTLSLNALECGGQRSKQAGKGIDSVTANDVANANLPELTLAGTTDAARKRMRQTIEEEIAKRPFKFTDHEDGHQLKFRSGHTILIKNANVEIRNPNDELMTAQDGTYHLSPGVTVNVESPRHENGRRINGEVRINYGDNKTFRAIY